MVHVLFFASLRERLGTSQESVALPAPANVGALVDALRVRGEVWAKSLAVEGRWRVAVNQEMATLDTPLKAGDEVAIFPPVTGG